MQGTQPHIDFYPTNINETRQDSSTIFEQTFTPEDNEDQSIPKTISYNINDGSNNKYLVNCALNNRKLQEL